MFKSTPRFGLPAGMFADPPSLSSHVVVSCVAASWSLLHRGKGRVLVCHWSICLPGHMGWILFPGWLISIRLLTCVFFCCLNMTSDSFEVHQYSLWPVCFSEFWLLILEFCCSRCGICPPVVIQYLLLVLCPVFVLFWSPSGATAVSCATCGYSYCILLTGYRDLSRMKEVNIQVISSCFASAWVEWQFILKWIQIPSVNFSWYNVCSVFPISKVCDDLAKMYH